MKIVVTTNLDYFAVDENGFLAAISVARPLMLENVTFTYNFGTVTSNPLIIEGDPSTNFTALSAMIAWDSMIGESLSSGMESFHGSGWRHLTCHTFANTWLWVANPNSTFTEGHEVSNHDDSYRVRPQDFAVWKAEGLMLGGAGNGPFLSHQNIGTQYVKSPIVANGNAYQDLLND